MVLFLLALGMQGISKPIMAGPASSEQPQLELPLQQKKVALVIDDFGNNMKGTEKMLSLPITFTVAVMPFLQTTKQDAEMAHKLGHDVIVHMPMEPKNGNPSWLGPGAITTRMSDEEIRTRVEAAINEVPHAIGMNNHMGSKVTGDERVMRVVLQVCKERGLFFLDSHTNYRTVAPKVARELGVPIAENQMFLDDEYTVKHISGQVRKIQQYMQTHEQCIVIGHVGVGGPKTASVLSETIPQLKASMTFVRVAELAHKTDK
ncbi:hypothetical protein BVG16_02260 [Paenibacillus selenitireducens]|jgi:hypothetical protein|uniref:Divergent polysaccharide deacetylase family protein n=2 Tax=Paenibacillus selenitireducens TaxID=1324314 RepID=A0A1T2XP77_9BACL|nr:hypothetical protein BVG16_02260 [Paenibacillus selenitireducens]